MHSAPIYVTLDSPYSCNTSKAVKTILRLDTFTSSQSMSSLESMARRISSKGNLCPFHSSFIRAVSPPDLTIIHTYTCIAQLIRCPPPCSSPISTEKLPHSPRRSQLPSNQPSSLRSRSRQHRQSDLNAQIRSVPQSRGALSITITTTPLSRSPISSSTRLTRRPVRRAGGRLHSKRARHVSDSNRDIRPSSRHEIPHSRDVRARIYHRRSRRDRE